MVAHLSPHTMGYNDELNMRVVARHQEILDKVASMQLEAEQQAPNNPNVAEARQLIETLFGKNALPPLPVKESFAPPDISNPFAEISLEDLESPQERMSRLSKSLTAGGLTKAERVNVMREIKQLRTQIQE